MQFAHIGSAPLVRFFAPGHMPEGTGARRSSADGRTYGRRRVVGVAGASARRLLAQETRARRSCFTRGSTELDEEQCPAGAGAAAFGAPDRGFLGGRRYYPGQGGTICSSGPKSQIGSNRSPAMTMSATRRSSVRSKLWYAEASSPLRIRPRPRPERARRGWPPPRLDPRESITHGVASACPLAQSRRGLDDCSVGRPAALFQWADTMALCGRPMRSWMSARGFVLADQDDEWWRTLWRGKINV